MTCYFAFLRRHLTLTLIWLRPDLPTADQSFAHFAATFIIGTPVQRREDTMKSRIVGISLLLSAALGMSACGSQPLPIPTPGAGPGAEASEAAGEGTPEAVETGVTRLTGDIEMSQQDFMGIYFVEPFVLLQD